MKKNLIVLIAFALIAFSSSAQKYYTKSGKINFDATTASSPEKIEGINRTATCVMDSKSGVIQFSMLMKGFAFERSLMEEHFNENYVESNKFPKAEFKGSIVNNETVNYAKDGIYTVTVKGKLTIHGETKDVETTGKLEVAGGKINASANFSVALADYKVAIPGIVADKVAKVATISVVCALEPLKS